MTRAQPIYFERPARGLAGKRLHLFRAEGIGIRSVCGDAQFVGHADHVVARCSDCRLVALTELALALDAIGAARAAHLAAESVWSEAELREAYGSR
jgi:hypothetical protein